MEQGSCSLLSAGHVPIKTTTCLLLVINRVFWAMREVKVFTLVLCSSHVTRQTLAISYMFLLDKSMKNVNMIYKHRVNFNSSIEIVECMWDDVITSFAADN